MQICVCKKSEKLRTKILLNLATTCSMEFRIQAPGQCLNSGDAFFQGFDSDPFPAMRQQPGMFPGPVPYPQVVKDVTDEGDVADPGLQGAGSQLLPILVLLLQPVEQTPPEDTLTHLLALCLWHQERGKELRHQR